MSEIKIIQLPPEQWQRYREIRLEALRKEPQAFGTTYADMLQKSPEFWQGRLAESAQAERSQLLFAEEGERIVGIIGAFYEDDGETASVISVFASKAARGKGVGKLMMEAILAEIGKKPGIRRAELGVNAEQAAAVALYGRFGFEVVEELEEEQGDGKMHRGYRMEKQL